MLSDVLGGAYRVGKNIIMFCFCRVPGKNFLVQKDKVRDFSKSDEIMVFIKVEFGLINVCNYNEVA